MKSFLAAFGLVAVVQAAALAQPSPPVPSDPAEEEEAAPAKPRPRPAARPTLRYGVDDLRLEYGSFRRAPEADHQLNFTGAAYVLGQPSRNLEWRIGARVDGADQRGGTADFSRWRADFTDTYLRWRDGETRLTAGMQSIVWGRIDEVPLIDRVSRTDLNRFVLDELADRRRSTPALRWEQGFGDFKADMVALPYFRPAALPDENSVWSVIDQRRGRVIGIEGDAGFQAFVRAARIQEYDADKAGGAAIRVTRTGQPPFDLGFTLARTRQSLPYYRADLAGLRLVEVHPLQTFAGVDGEFVAGSVTWRGEFGHTGSVPLTRPDGQMVFGNAWDAAAAAEFFPGGKDVRVSLQLVAREVRANQAVLERTKYVGVNGEVQATVAQGRWRVGMRFASGINAHDVYLAPKISYLGWEPHEIYIAAHHFDGDERSLGGFHRDHGIIVVGLRARF